MNSKRIVFSYLNKISVETMTKEEAQEIIKKMDPSKVEKIKRWIQKWFRKKPLEREASFFDIVKKVNKATGIPLMEIAAVGLLFFGGLSPSFADMEKQETKTEQSPAEIRQEIEKKFELPEKLENLVEKTPQGLINMMGIKGFINTVKRNIEKSLTPEISELLSRIPENQWPKLLSDIVMQKIKQDPEVSVKFDAFVKSQKTTDKDLKDEIERVVMNEKSSIKNHIESVRVKKAMERGYLMV